MTHPLPAAVQTALRSIEADLRDLPRDCIGDAGELLIWLRRQANRVAGVREMRVAGTFNTAPGRPTRRVLLDRRKVG